MSDDKEPLDFHCFEVWRYTDGSFDLNAKVHDGPFDLKNASDAALMITRCMREDVRNTRLCYSVEVYNDGQTSSHWRNDDDLATNLREFLWAKRALHRGTYGAMLPFPKMPSWLINFMSFMEYCVAMIWKLWVTTTGLGANYTVESSSAKVQAAQPLNAGQDSSEELSEGSESIVDHTAGNVVWVRQWRNPKDPEITQ